MNFTLLKKARDAAKLKYPLAGPNDPCFDHYVEAYMLGQGECFVDFFALQQPSTEDKGADE